MQLFRYTNLNVEVESARSSNPQVRLLLTLVFVLSLTAVLLVWNKDELLLRRDMLSPFSTSSKQLRFCSYSIQNMTNTTNPLDRDVYSFEEIDNKLAKAGVRVEQGGISLAVVNHKCKSKRNNIAIIVPYRNRLRQLKVFLNNMHLFLTRQQVNYGVYVIEPMANLTFNRGLVLNIGYLEATRDAALNGRGLTWTCFIFHDVDMWPEDMRNVYDCDENIPLHLAHTRSSRNYSTVGYQKYYFGGVEAMTVKQFASIDGFSNLFFGWGAEDDNLRERVNRVYRKFIKAPPEIGRYYADSHSAEEKNMKRRVIFDDLKKHMLNNGSEGLSTINFTLISVTRQNLFTQVFVKYDQEYLMNSFYKKNNTLKNG